MLPSPKGEPAAWQPGLPHIPYLDTHWQGRVVGSFQLPLYTGFRSSSAPLPAGRLTLPHHHYPIPHTVHHDSGQSHLFHILLFLLIRNRLPGRQLRWSALRTIPYLFPVFLHIGASSSRSHLPF